MKEFMCKDLGQDCREVLTAGTEDRLVEEAAVHLREAHGVASITQDMIAKIRNIIVNRSTQDAASVVDRIFEKYNCDREPECTWRFIAEAEMILNGGERVHERELRAA